MQSSKSRTPSTGLPRSALAALPISAGELARAGGPRIAAAKRALLSNTVWLNTLAAAQRDPRALALAMRASSDLQSLTADDIQSGARRWLVQAKNWRAEVLPESQRVAARATDAPLVGVRHGRTSGLRRHGEAPDQRRADQQPGRHHETRDSVEAHRRRTGPQVHRAPACE